MIEQESKPKFVWQLLNVLFPQKRRSFCDNLPDSAQVSEPVNKNFIPFKEHPYTPEEMRKAEKEIEEMERIINSPVDEIFPTKPSQK